MNCRAEPNGVLNHTYFVNIGLLDILQFRLQFYISGTFFSTTRALNNYETCKKKRTDPNQHLQMSFSVILTAVTSEFSNLEGTTKQTKLNEWIVHILHTMLARVVCNCDNTLPDSTKRALMGKKLQ